MIDFKRLARMFKPQASLVFVAAAPGYVALHVDAASTPDNPILLAVPVVAWQLDSEGRASPVVAAAWDEPADDGRWWSLETPSAHILTTDAWYATRAEYVAAVVAGARIASKGTT